MLRPTRAMLALLLVCLLVSVDASLQTSIVFDRTNAWWTPWLYKVGPLSVADVVIIGVTAFTLFQLILRGFAILKSPYLAICSLALAYLGLGLLYNLLVYPAWKPFLFDVKTFLYLIVPYLFLHTSRDQSIANWFSPKRLFFYGLIAAAGDLVVVTLQGEIIAEQSIFGLPVVPPFLPAVVPLVGVLLVKTPWHRFLFLLLFGAVMANLLNRLEIIGLFHFAIAAVVVTTLATYRNKGRISRVATVLLMAVAAHLGSALIVVYDPFETFFSEFKSGGILIRQLQFENALLSLERNFPTPTGTGLGTTWFEYIPIVDPTGYSIGTSVGTTLEESRAMPVKYIFNWTAPILLYRWGLLGTVTLYVLAGVFFESAARKIGRIKELNSDQEDWRFLYAVLLIAFVFILEHFSFFGSPSPSLVTSLLAFYVENELRRKLATFPIESERNSRRRLAS